MSDLITFGAGFAVGVYRKSAWAGIKWAARNGWRVAKRASARVREWGQRVNPFGRG